MDKIPKKIKQEVLAKEDNVTAKERIFCHFSSTSFSYQPLHTHLFHSQYIFQFIHIVPLNFSLHFPTMFFHFLLIFHLISCTVPPLHLYHYYFHVCCSLGLSCATHVFLFYFLLCPSFLSFSLPSSPALTLCSLPPLFTSISSAGSDGGHVLRQLCDTFSKQNNLSPRNSLIKKHTSNLASNQAKQNKAMSRLS